MRHEAGPRLGMVSSRRCRGVAVPGVGSAGAVIGAIAVGDGTAEASHCAAEKWRWRWAGELSVGSATRC